MPKVHPWLIQATALILSRPKVVILIPILCVFVTAYNVLYDFTLRPINSGLASHFNNFTLHDGPVFEKAHTLQRLSHTLAQLATGPLVLSRVSVADSSSRNTLRYDFLEDVLRFQNSLDCVVVLPLTTWPLVFDVPRPLLEDKHKIEKFVLKTVNHDQNLALLGVFFDHLGKQNHMIKLAGVLHVYMLHDKSVAVLALLGNLTLPNLTLFQVLELRTLVGKHAVPEFVTYVRFLRGEISAINWLISSVHLMQAVLFVALLMHCYLSICNQHKIRSNLGLMIGWLAEVVVAAASSISILGYLKGLPTWFAVFQPVSWFNTGAYVLAIMLFSSRNLFRTINDLAGDNTFGAQDNIHKRLIKFYLGINSSVYNSQGVFRISTLLRRILHLDTRAALPVPNTSLILAINMAGLVLVVGLGCGVLGVFARGILWQHYARQCLNILEAFILGLVIDHGLQLTFLVGVIVIDLNRIELTDLLNNSSPEPSLHEVNPISAWLLGLNSPNRPSNKSWRYRVGTHLLKISPPTLSQFWLLTVPVFFIMHCVFQMLIAVVVFPMHSLEDGSGVMALDHEKICVQKYHSLYYLELLTIIVFVIAVAELTFTLTYSKRQRKEVDLGPATFSASHSLLALSELGAIDETKYFECIDLDVAHHSDILKLASNPKSSFLVSTDLDHSVLVWSPLSKVERQKPVRISTFFEPSAGRKVEFWPINHLEISNDGNFIVLVNNKHRRIKCFGRKSLAFLWEISLTAELNIATKKMNPVGTFFRKKTIAGFLARMLMLKKKKSGRRNSITSMTSSNTITGNYPPPAESKDNKASEYEKSLSREEFVMVLETGEMITVSCNDRKLKAHNILEDLYADLPELPLLSIGSLEMLTTSRVNDRIVCYISNGDIVVGTAVNNIWRFSKLELNRTRYNKTMISVPASLMAISDSTSSAKHDFSTAYEMERNNSKFEPVAPTVPTGKKYPAINRPTIVTIDFVGMIIRVTDLRAELIDTLTGTILKKFHIGVFKPKSFRVAHSEPTHCKFCGCASVESLSLVYQDFYDRTVIVHTFTIESKKSRNNICLRVERDPREIRCLGFDSVVETQYWYENIEKWEVTDMNVVIGIRNAQDDNVELLTDTSDGFSTGNDGLQSLRARKQNVKPIEREQGLSDIWQGFVITLMNGKLLEYSIPQDDHDSDFASTRANAITRYGYKSMAIAFGLKIKILYIGGDKLIESDLYYSGSTSTLDPILNTDGVANSNELLFINKRRRTLERKKKQAE